MEAISKVIRVKLERKSITPEFKEFMLYNNGSLMEYFSAVDLDFYKSETGTLIVQPDVLVKYVKEFTWKIIEKRKQDAYNVKMKVFVEGGGGFFKLGIGTVDVGNYFSGDITKRSNYTKSIFPNPVIRHYSEEMSQIFRRIMTTVLSFLKVLILEIFSLHFVRI